MNFTYKKIFAINLPVMASMLMEQLVNLTDTLFLGRVGETELGTAALGSMYYTSVYMLGLGFSLGVQVVVARKNGKGDHEGASNAFRQGFLFLTALAVLLFSLSQFFSPEILRLLIRSDEVYRAAVQYVHWRDYSFLSAFPLLAIRALLIGTTRTKALAVNSLLLVGSNVLLNYLLIFGHGGFPPLGISGAALASSLAELIALAHLAYAVRKDFRGTSFSVDFPTMKNLFNLSFWTMARSFFCVAPWLLFFIAIEHLGERQLAAANIVRSISMIFFVIVNSLATTGISLVGNLLGAGQSRNLFPTLRKVILLGYATGLPLLMLALLFPTAALGLFTGDTTIVQTALPPFLVMLSTYILSVPAYTFCNAVIGTGRTKTAFGFQMITIGAYLAYLGFLSQTKVPLAVFWTAEQLYVAMLWVLSAAYLKKYRKGSTGKISSPGS